MKVLGIDPGITATGFGIIKDDSVISTGTIRPKAKDHNLKILEICHELREIISTSDPDIAVIEKAFYEKNISSLMRVSELRGAVIYMLLLNNLKVHEYTPAQIKLTTTGNGRASKEQVRFFIERILLDSQKKISNHAVDALAIAYTGLRKLKTRRLS